ncbi:hypothetical protein OF83DRAFT_448522 [Amylostereum chailletii]|nr:hypothetical protein OF83DRAFT_448522 [Amylostereum chailletii]
MSKPGGEEIDPRLIGPGVPSPVDLEGPAPKRRSSMAESQRAAPANVFDRRHSVDARTAPNSSQWWPEGRRDSASSIFSNPSLGYGSPAFSADSPHVGQPPPGAPTFAWHTTQPFDQPSAPRDDSEAGPGRPAFDPSSVPPMGMVPPTSFTTDRRMSMPTNLPSTLPPNTATARALRSRSRPPSRSTRGVEQATPGSSTAQDTLEMDAAEHASPSPSSAAGTREANPSPYSRSPELRVSHKLAERKRRKEMKELFDELRDQLPADRAMKASKWEILTKAIDFIAQLKQAHQDAGREIEMLRRELESVRPGIPQFPPGAAVAYPAGVPNPFPPGVPPVLPHALQPPHPPPAESSQSPSALQDRDTSVDPSQKEGTPGS